MFFKSVIFLLVLCFSGCSVFQKKSDAIKACDEIIKKTSNAISFLGFKVSLEGNKSATLGLATYTPQQLIIVGQRVLELEQYKLMQCSLLEVALKAHPSPSYTELEPLLKSIAGLNIDILNIAKKISNSTDPQGVVDSIIEENKIPYQMYFIEPQSLGLFNDHLNQHTSSLSDIKTSIKVLQDSLGTIHQVRELSDGKFVISGFSTNSNKLNKEMESSIIENLTALIKNESRKIVFIDVVGYTDSSGNYQKNVKLGLERAASVSEFISNIHGIGNPILRTIASGGISKSSEEGGRKVEVYLTISK